MASANPNDLITYTITLVVSGGPVTNVVVTDVLPAPLSFVGFGSTPPGGVISYWNPSTATLSWSFAPLNPGTYIISYQTQVGSDPQPPVMTNNAQLIYNGLANPKTTAVTVVLGNPRPIFYPNPIRGDGPANLQIAFNQAQDHVGIKVYTTAFRKVYEDNIRSVPQGTFLYDLEVNNFKGGRASNGLYYLEVTTPSNRWVIKLLIFK